MNDLDTIDAVPTAAAGSFAAFVSADAVAAAVGTRSG